MNLVEDIVPVDDLWGTLFQFDPLSIASTKGVCVILDIANFELKFLKFLTPQNIKTAVSRIQMMPIREYRFHIINKSMLINVAIKLIWNFLPTSIQEVVSCFLEIINT